MDAHSLIGGCGRVGSRRVALGALFRHPPSEPDLQDFQVSGSPVNLFDDLRRVPRRVPGMDRVVASFALRLPRSSMMSSVVSASRMSRTSTSCHQVLSPFAMCPAFPDADYYGDSVAVELAPLGDPELSNHRTYERGLGRLLIPTPGIITRYLTVRVCRARKTNASTYGDAVLSQRNGGAAFVPIGIGLEAVEL